MDAIVGFGDKGGYVQRVPDRFDPSRKPELRFRVHVIGWQNSARFGSNQRQVQVMLGPIEKLSGIVL